MNALTAAWCNAYGIPLWWAGKPMTDVRYHTIMANMGRYPQGLAGYVKRDKNDAGNPKPYPSTDGWP